MPTDTFEIDGGFSVQLGGALGPAISKFQETLFLTNRTTLTGRGRVDGTVSKRANPTNLPAAALVRLYRDVDGVLIDQANTTVANNAYSFVNLDMTYQYTALAYDRSSGVYRVVGADRLTPTLMS